MASIVLHGRAKIFEALGQPVWGTIFPGQTQIVCLNADTLLLNISLVLYHWFVRP
jgi:hypothetical protein